MKVVITGGFGFLGLHVCKRLLAIGELADAEDQSQEVSQIILFDQGTPKGIPEDPRVQLRVGDIADPAQGQQLVDEDGMVIFHLASVMSGQGRGCKFIFASSGACFGERPPGPETDGTKLLPETSYGKLFLLLGLPTQLLSLQALPPFPTLTLPLRRNGHGLPNREPNSGLPAAFSDVLREPLWKRDCILPLPPDLRHAVCGYRVLVRNLIHLANLPAAAFESSDRCMNLPCLSVTLHDLHEALKRIVDPSKLGQVSYAPDEALAAKLRTFHHDMDAERARRLGMVGDSSAAAIAADFAAEYVDEALLKPVMEIFEEPRHWRTFGNEYVNVYRVENAPGDTTLMHIHRVDSLYFFFSCSQVQGTKWKEEPKDDTLEDGEVRYGDHGNCTLTHRIHNKCRPVMMCLDVEFVPFGADAAAGAAAGAAPAAKRAKTEVPGLKLIKERPACRVYTLEVAPGATASVAVPFARTLLVVHRGARVQGLGVVGLVKPGDVFFREGPEELKLDV
ncbi:unnamed protein product, partial [Durusdinium trenchii]